MKKSIILGLAVFLITAQVCAQTEVKIGKQVWMAENLQLDTFRNGDTIPWAQSAEEWINAGKNKQPAWCYYETCRCLGDTNSPAENGLRYGKLYNWYAVNNPRGLAPVGWHVPSKAEWEILESHLGGSMKAARKMRLKKDWGEDDKGTNRSGFTALPGGYRSENFYFGKGNSAYWWTSTEEPENETRRDPVNATIHYDRRTDHYFFDFGTGGRNPHFRYSDGLSVRCIKD